MSPEQTPRSDFEVKKYNDDIEESIVVAFNWLLETEAFCDQNNDLEVPDNESRATEIGNVYAYALSEGIDYDRVDELYNQASN